MVVLAIVLLPSTFAFARAGGGGGGGNSSSRSIGTSGSNSGGSQTSTSKGDLFTILGFGALTAFGGVAGIIYKVKLQKKKFESTLAMKKFAKEDGAWDYDKICSDIDEAFYKVQNAWTERNQDLAKEYMSERIYKIHKSKTEWMKLRGEKNVLYNINLISIKPISAVDSDDNSRDAILVNIKASMVDYMLNEYTNEVTEGDPSRRSTFEEFWRFIRSDKRWILDEIKQPEEIGDINNFINEKIK